MKKSELLRRAKKHLRTAEEAVAGNSGKPLYVCFAVMDSTRNPLRHDVCEDISDLLGRDDSVVAWLHGQGIRSQLTTVNVQTYRHLWVDHMIAQYEAKGE